MCCTTYTYYQLRFARTHARGKTHVLENCSGAGSGPRSLAAFVTARSSRRSFVRSVRWTAVMCGLPAPGADRSVRLAIWPPRSRRVASLARRTVQQQSGVGAADLNTSAHRTYIKLPRQLILCVSPYIMLNTCSKCCMLSITFSFQLCMRMIMVCFPVAADFKAQ